jgi:hypothetical protein
MPTEEQTYRIFLEKRLDKQDKTLEEILIQTKRTNGRVSKLESWQAYVIGFCACLTIVVLPTLFMAAKAFFQV